MSELLPCPFCGSESEYKFLNELGVEAARCNKCQITISLSKWNTRFRSGTRPQIVNLELEDLADSVQGNTKTEEYIEKLENANSCYFASIGADREKIRAMHKENNHLKSLLHDAYKRFRQYEIEVITDYDVYDEAVPTPQHHIDFMTSVEKALGINKEDSENEH